ncbi:MAG: exodeoxyribonuclease VII large subunit [Heliobacteriaceae bacterium]|nr:exodeoxyribonuclease VII large subunit [Heliobacteriaceae bacterium]
MEIWSVTQLNKYIQGLLEQAPELAAVWVKGELSNFKHHPSGHMYFTLRDRDSAVKAVMFRGRNRFLKFRPENGLQVLVKGQVAIYPRDGVYQVYAQEMEPAGLGGIFLALEQTRQRLAAAGLFAPERKRPLPLLPRKIGIVTAPSGAAIRDLLAVIRRRFPPMPVVLSPAIVQGAEAAPSLIRGLERLASWPGVDVVIIGRGGGSREDLWAFNDEALCRVVAGHPVPVVAAVGHESDVSLCDLVADVRAATPSAAAELAVPVLATLELRLNEQNLQLQRAALHRLQRARLTVDKLGDRTTLGRPLERLRVPRQRVDDLTERLKRTGGGGRVAERRTHLAEMEKTLHVLAANALTVRGQWVAMAREQLFGLVTSLLRDRRRHLSSTAVVLDALSPLAILERGFSLCLDREGQSVRNAGAVSTGMVVDIVLQKGELTCRVEERKEEHRWTRIE